MKRLLTLVSFALVVFGCAGSSTLAPTQYRTRVFAASYNATFEGTVDYLIDRGYKVTKSDLRSGTIETDYKQGAGWAEAFPGDKRAKVNGQVINFGENEAKLILTIICEERTEFSGWQEVGMNVGKEQIFYKNFFDSIEIRAKLKSK